MADNDNTTAPLSRAELNKLEAQQRAAEKWAPELRVIENIADNFVLPDAEVELTGLIRGSGLGFTGTEAGGIRFNGTPPDSDEYRGSSEEHAVKFAKAFNNAFLQTNGAGQVVGSLVNRDIAKAQGNVVSFDLGGLREVLSQHTIADALPSIAKGYSKNYFQEKGAAQVDRMVEIKIQQRHMERQQEKVHGKVLEQLNAIIDESAQETNQRIQQLTATDPQLSQIVRKAFEEILDKAGEYNASGKDEKTLEGVGEEYLPLVKRAAERLEKREQKMRGETPEGAEAPAEAAAPDAKDAPEAAADAPEAAPTIRDLAKGLGGLVAQKGGHAAREAVRRASGGSKEIGG